MKRNAAYSFVALAALSGNALAATYYVKPNGDDGADGKSHASAWKTVQKVNRHAFKRGDDVYFLVNGTWKRQALRINWDGTGADRAIIGAYHVRNGKEIPGVPKGARKPVLTGSYSGPCKGKAGSCIQSPKAVPARGFLGLVQIGGSYVTLENLMIRNSAGRGIVLRNDQKHVIIQNNKVRYTAGNSLVLGRGSSYNIVRNNDTSLCAMGWKHGDWIVVSQTWPTCNSAVGSHHNIFERNYIHESYGEGIALLLNATNNIVRSNTIAGVRSTNIYMDNSSGNIVENNVLIGDRDGEYVRGTRPDGHRYGGGIAVKVEHYPPRTYDSVDNLVRNNLLVRTDGLLMGLEKGAERDGRKVGVKFLHNTLVETSFYVNMNDGTRFYDGDTVVANNIFYGSPSQSSGCRIRPANVSFHHNHWDSKQRHPACNDAASDQIGNPMLARRNWDGVGFKNRPKPRDFRPQSGSSALSTGIALTKPVFKGLFNQAHRLLGNCRLDLSAASRDFHCAYRGAQPDMGAINTR